MAKHGGQAPKWTLQSSLADMEKAGVTTAVLSLAPPGVWFGDVEEGRSLARACNEYGAQLRKDNPGRFGLFAAIPLPDTEGSLREIDYALDVLKADGIGLYTSYGEKYLGDAAFVPVFEELNRRRAVVYTHPVNPACCTHLADGVGPSSIEFATDTTRTIASLIFGKAGTAFRCPDIRFIWSHSGGTLPFLIGRFIREQVVRKDPRMPDGPEPLGAEIFLRDRPGQRAGPVGGAVEARAGIAAVVRLGFSLSRGQRSGRRPCRLHLQRCRARLDRSRDRVAPAAGARRMKVASGAAHNKRATFLPADTLKR